MERVALVAGFWFLFWMIVGSVVGGLTGGAHGGVANGIYFGAFNGAWWAVLTSFAWPWLMPEFDPAVDGPLTESQRIFVGMAMASRLLRPPSPGGGGSASKASRGGVSLHAPKLTPPRCLHSLRSLGVDPPPPGEGDGAGGACSFAARFRYPRRCWGRPCGGAPLRFP